MLEVAEGLVWGVGVVAAMVALVWPCAVLDRRSRCYDAKVLEVLGAREMTGMELERAGAVPRPSCYPILKSMVDRGLLTSRKVAHEPFPRLHFRAARTGRRLATRGPSTAMSTPGLDPC